MRTSLTTGLTFALIAVSACGSDSNDPAQPEAITVSVRNRLDVAIQVSAPGTIAPAVTTALTLPPGTTMLTWTPVKRRANDGSELPDDLTGGQIAVQQSGTIEVTNVVAGVTYFSPVILTNVAGDASFEVVQPGRPSRCLGYRTGPSSGTFWGYYRLEVGTTVRLFRGRTCTGASSFWRYEQLVSDMEAGTGLVRLRYDAMP